MQNPAVTIIGAGPTGLMMACQLSRFNIPFRIIDEKSGPVEETRALAVQARTLEVYDQMGIADYAVKNGLSTNAINFIVKGKRKVRVALTDIGTGLSPFPFLHIFTQDKNEELLASYLTERNISVEWNTKLIQMTQNENEVTAVVEKNGVREEVKSKWLVGADGGKSIVRHSLDLKFPGDTYENVFYVADTAVNWEIGAGELFLYMSTKSFAAFFPMQGEKRFRLVGILPKRFQNEDKVTFDDIKGDIKNSLESKIDFYDTKWFSVYRLHHRCVERFREGRCFLAGDAAHIHSPAGGQGMNTGLQDAYNLAWKIAFVEKNLAHEKLLDTYNEERLPFAKRLVKTTDRGFGIIVSEKPFWRIMRLYIFPRLIKFAMRFGSLRKFFFRTISQIAINYRSSSLTRSGIGRGDLKAGDRFPYFNIYQHSLGKEISIYDLLKNPVFNLIIFHRNSDNEKLKSFHDMTSDYPGMLEIIVIPFSEKDRIVFDRLKIKDDFVCLVRPDNYIAYLSDKIDVNELKSYFKDNLRVTRA